MYRCIEKFLIKYYINYHTRHLTKYIPTFIGNKHVNHTTKGETKTILENKLYLCRLFDDSKDQENVKLSQ